MEIIREEVGVKVKSPLLDYYRNNWGMGGGGRWGAAREEVFLEGFLEPNMGPSLADVLLCTFGSTNAGFFISFEKTSVLGVIIVPLQHFLSNETLQHVDSTEK
jgi:hypothetical protein